MKKIFISLLLAAGLFMLSETDARAATGDIGFFGGITEGTRLPKTTEQMIAAANTRAATNRNVTNQIYKEVVFITGEPVEVEGLLSIRQQGSVVDTADIGTYRITYSVARSAASGDNTITRNITFNVNWRREGSQIIKDYDATAWTESLVINGNTYTLDFAQSRFNLSILEDHTPAVIYSKGDISAHAYYTVGEGSITHDLSGTVSGYESAWSNTETHRLDGEYYTDGWQMSYQVRPSVSVYKTLQYSKNEPVVISFDGNYREVMQNESGLSYDIFNTPTPALEIPLAGLASISVFNTFEQLPSYDLKALQGHFAVNDIHKLFSMGILEGLATQYNPSQLTKRGEFVTMLVKAIKLPIQSTTTTNNRNTRNQPLEFTFPDVLPERPDYPYIMAAYKAGIAGGRGQGMFYADYSIQRQEAICMLMRTLGLSSLGLEPTNTTMFADDENIAGWAKKELYAASKIGIIRPDSKGNIYPTQEISKAEAAAIINSLIEYMRAGMRSDYTMFANYAN